MFYEKQLRYLEYWKNGERLRAAGFVKIEVTGEYCNLQLQVTGLSAAENGVHEVRLSGGRNTLTSEYEKAEEVLGSVTLENGKGSLMRRRVQADNLCGGISYDQLLAVRIVLGKEKELLCRWKEDTPEDGIQTAKEVQTAKEAQTAEETKAVEDTQTVEEAGETLPTIASQELQASVQDGSPGAGTALASYDISQTKPEPVPAVRSETAERSTQAVMQETAEKSAPTMMRETAKRSAQAVMQETTAKRISEEIEEVARGEARVHDGMQTKKVTSEGARKLAQPIPLSGMKEQKWQQLSEIYPHISPFHDERDYLSIGPGDFVILPQQFYRLVVNSFLLHGYYNYGHLVLARRMRRGQEAYYLGVPGNFFEREREVALMFGFESFECRREPASEGDYGYFMIRIDI